MYPQAAQSPCSVVTAGIRNGNPGTHPQRGGESGLLQICLSGQLSTEQLDTSVHIQAGTCCLAPAPQVLPRERRPTRSRWWTEPSRGHQSSPLLLVRSVASRPPTHAALLTGAF